MSAQRRMSVPAAPADDDDLEAFVSGGATVSKPDPERKTAPTRKRTARKAPKPKPDQPPWEGIEGGKKQLPLFLPARSKAQLDYIKETTGAPIQHLLRELLIDAIEERAMEVWQG